jgi:cytochrome c peroxidase
VAENEEFDATLYKNTTKYLMMKIFLLSVCFLFSSAVIANEPIKPVNVIPYDKEKAALGKQLFSEVRLSKDDSLSCESCHLLDQFGIDHVAKSVGINGSLNKRNSPTIFNVGFNFLQLWDGRATEQKTNGE